MSGFLGRALRLICAVVFAGLLPQYATAQQALPKLRAGIYKMADLTPVWFAAKSGIFRKNGLDVELIEFQIGAAVMAQRSGQVDVILTTPGSVFTANERGFDLTAILSMELAQVSPPDSASIQVLKNSPIRSVKDLAGKSLSTPARHTQAYVTLLATLRKHGVDPKTVSFREMPLASQTSALLAGRLDAVNVVDPFTTQLLKTGKTRVLTWPNLETIPGVPVGVWFARRSFVKQNPALVERFNRSVVEAINYFNEDVPRANRLTAEFTGLDPALVVQMTPMRYSTDVEPDKWQKAIELMRTYGELKEPHTPDEYFSDHIKPYIKK